MDLHKDYFLRLTPNQTRPPLRQDTYIPTATNLDYDPFRRTSTGGQPKAAKEDIGNVSGQHKGPGQHAATIDSILHGGKRPGVHHNGEVSAHRLYYPSTPQDYQ